MSKLIKYDKMQNKIKFKLVVNLLVTCLIFSSCFNSTRELMFDIDKQEVISCTRRDIYHLYFENDSIKNGYSVGNNVSINWDYKLQKEKRASNLIELNNIPAGYIVENDGKKVDSKKIKLIPNSKYIVTWWGAGEPQFKLKIFTNSEGRVYKTTHPTCGLKSLQ